MPYPNEHACRLAQPIEGAQTRRKNGEREHEGKKYDVIYQEGKDGTWHDQAFRYPKGTWEADVARAHCQAHEGEFEPASGGTQNAALNEIAVTEGKVPEWVEICRTGAWLGHPQTPEIVTPTRLRAAAEAYQLDFAANGADMVIDYHHASTLAPLGGTRAPAAGWIQAVELRNNDTELWGKVLWTSEAAAAIARREYRYLSPVLQFDWPDRVTGDPVPMRIHSVALTNTPFMTELSGLNQAAGVAGRFIPASKQGGELMTLRELLCQALGLKPEEVASKLGLPEAVDDKPTAEALVANAQKAKDLEAQVATLTARPVCEAVANALGVAADAGLSAVTAAIEKLKAPGNAAALAVRTTLELPPEADDQAVLNAIMALGASRKKSEAEELVDDAVKAGKVPPAQREFYLKAALADIAGARAALNSMQSIGQGGMGQRQADGDGPKATDAEVKVAGQLGVEPKEVVAHRKK